MSNYSELLEGNKVFQEGYFEEHRDDLVGLVENGQHPVALFITCSDSRVVPNQITQTGPGDLFVTRNIGNFVPPYKPEDAYHATASAIEYAVSALKVPHIIVCGHTHCGAMATLYKMPDGEHFVHVRKWLELGDATKERVASLLEGKVTDEQILRKTEEANVVIQMENLLTYPAVREGVISGDIEIHGWIYDLENGSIRVYDSESNSFREEQKND